MKLNALLLDPALLGDDGWGYLERVCGMLPDLGVVVCTGRSTVAQRVRGLRLGVDDWITKPCHPEEAIARIEAVAAPPPPRSPRGRGRPARRRRAGDPPRPVPGLRRRRQPRPDPARVRAAAAARRGARARCSSARRSTSGSGATRWPTATARSTSSSASCARSCEKRSPGWSYIHTHFGVGYRFDPEPVGGAVEEPTLPASRGRGPDRRPRSEPRFTSRSQQLHAPDNRLALAPTAMLGDHGDRERAVLARLEPGAWRSGPRSTPPWSTAAR